MRVRDSGMVSVRISVRVRISGMVSVRIRVIAMASVRGGVRVVVRVRNERIRSKGLG